MEAGEVVDLVEEGSEGTESLVGIGILEAVWYTDGNYLPTIGNHVPEKGDK